MKKIMFLSLFCLFCCFLIAGPVTAEEVSNYELNERIKNLEEKIGESDGQEWTNRITISGVLEAEAGFVSTDFADAAQEDTDESDIVLATAELGIDAQIAMHVSGHILFLYEEGENDDNIAVDEGFITIDGQDVVPLYLNAGKLYVPFGNFESHMISDPLTLELGETGQSAIQIGFSNEMLDVSIAVFNGDVDQTGDDNAINSYVGSVQFSLPEDTVANFGLSGGISYLSNIADSDGLEGVVATADGTIEDHVAGLGAFISVSFMDMIFLEAEYIGALDKFQAGELSIDGGTEAEPSAWNLELAYSPVEDLEVALRYGQTDDIKGGEFLPETQYGATVAYGLFDSTTVALEYLKNEYENNDEQSVVTAQLAIEF
jgi:hypothetical protein